eukprot:GHVT01087663.1.p1 GENE.GHVT01087663.1~~GHVT01087663.1.p1  ORF type:complete len:354 (+),score=14.72 GHVT01087663.1:1744-2805(+)
MQIQRVISVHLWAQRGCFRGSVLFPRAASQNVYQRALCGEPNSRPLTTVCRHMNGNQRQFHFTDRWLSRNFSQDNNKTPCGRIVEENLRFVDGDLSVESKDKPDPLLFGDPNKSPSSLTSGAAGLSNLSESVPDPAVQRVVSSSTGGKDDDNDRNFTRREVREEFAAERAAARSGPEPCYTVNLDGCSLFRSTEPFTLSFGGVLPEVQIAYETCGQLNKDKTNAILLCTGLSASSHAKSHSKNPSPGWWENFIGPASAIDTSKFFVICANNLGGCFGTTGPMSINPQTGERYSLSFPPFTVQDMVRLHFRLLGRRHHSDKCPPADHTSYQLSNYSDKLDEKKYLDLLRLQFVV